MKKPVRRLDKRSAPISPPGWDSEEVHYVYQEWIRQRSEGTGRSDDGLHAARHYRQCLERIRKGRS